MNEFKYYTHKEGCKFLAAKIEGNLMIIKRWLNNFGRGYSRGFIECAVDAKYMFITLQHIGGRREIAREGDYIHRLNEDGTWGVMPGKEFEALVEECAS